MGGGDDKQNASQGLAGQHMQRRERHWCDPRTGAQREASGGGPESGRPSRAQGTLAGGWDTAWLARARMRGL